MRKAIYIAILSVNVLIPIQSYSQAIAMREQMIDEDPASSMKAETPFTFLVNANAYNELGNELGEIETSFIRNHPINIEVAKRLHLFEETYTYYSEAAPGAFSDQKVIHKPVIYSCVNKIEKHFRKQVRTGNTKQDEAGKQLCNILDTAIILYDYNTDHFEQALKDTRSPVHLAKLFHQVQIIESDL